MAKFAQGGIVKKSGEFVFPDFAKLERQIMAKAMKRAHGARKGSPMELLGGRFRGEPIVGVDTHVNPHTRTPSYTIYTEQRVTQQAIGMPETEVVVARNSYNLTEAQVMQYAMQNDDALDAMTYAKADETPTVDAAKLKEVMVKMNDAMTPAMQSIARAARSLGSSFDDLAAALKSVVLAGASAEPTPWIVVAESEADARAILARYDVNPRGVCWRRAHRARSAIFQTGEFEFLVKLPEEDDRSDIDYWRVRSALVHP